MPKDDWHQSRARHMNEKRVQEHISCRLPYWEKHNILETPCWFGKYKGKKFKDIPRDYIEWLCSSTENNYGFIIKLRSLLEQKKI